MEDKLLEFITKLLEENYELGNNVKVEPIKAGDTNNSFFAYADKDGKNVKWYVRQYNPAEQEQDIIFEHALEKYYDKNVNGEIQTMLPKETKDGKTWVVAKFNDQDNFYAVFNVISGLEPYSWEYNDMDDKAMDSCAAIVAKFQSWCYGFVGPEGSGRREAPLAEQFANWRVDLPNAIEEKKKNKVFKRYSDYLETQADLLMDHTDFCEKQLKKYESKLKKCINHKDLNPGNVMFDENDNVIAVFDLDWANTDYRVYDLAWMAYQAIASWNPKKWGDVPFDKLQRFIDVYNAEMIKRNCPLGPLTKDEEEFLPAMMMIGAMKVIMDFACYEEHAHDVHRVLVNTSRFIESVNIMRRHIEED